MWPEVDAWWAEVLDLPRDAVTDGGRHSRSSRDDAGVLVFADGRPPLVYGTQRMLAELEMRSSDLSPDAIAAVLSSPQHRTIGPTWLGYLFAAPRTRSSRRAVRAMDSADIPALEELHRVTPASEVNESGTDDLPAVGAFDGARLLSVACVKSWCGRPTIAVLTRPDARGRGLGRAVVAEAARAALTEHAFVQYRVSHTNIASLGIARAVGFHHYADRWLVERNE